jgi:cellulose synthase/poly-beta-1,6-N-acetylglucosamine synthase-like glycosyltransferase
VTVGLLALVFLLVDLQNVLSRWRGRVLDPTAETTDDFTILVPLYGDPKYFANRGQLEPRKAHVLLCLDVSDPRMLAWSYEAEADGWRVHRMICKHLPPGPSELCLEPIRAGKITTGYAIRVDGDTYPSNDLGHAVAAAADAGDEIRSVKVVPTSRRRVVEALQGIEYEMSMLSRHVRPWQTSGACIIGKTESLRRALQLHSHWFPGEDMETGRVAAHLRMKIKHIDFRVLTDVPATWRHLFRQRRLWWAGNFRHVVVNFDSNLAMPVWTLYYVLLTYLLASGKIMAFFDGSLHNLPAILLAYTGVSVLANWQVRSKWMIAYPYYALVQSAVMPAFGLVYYVAIAWKRRCVGRYRIGPFGRRARRLDARPAT